MRTTWWSATHTPLPRKMVADIKRLNPSNYTCNFSFGCMPIELAHRSIIRFKSEVVPLIEKEVGLSKPLDGAGC